MEESENQELVKQLTKEQERELEQKLIEENRKLEEFLARRKDTIESSEESYDDPDEDININDVEQAEVLSEVNSEELSYEDEDESESDNENKKSKDDNEKSEDTNDQSKNLNSRDEKGEEDYENRYEEEIESEEIIADDNYTNNMPDIVENIMVHKVEKRKSLSDNIQDIPEDSPPAKIGRIDPILEDRVPDLENENACTRIAEQLEFIADGEPDDNIPISYQNALVFNETYQNHLHSVLDMLQEALQNNRNRQEEIESDLVELEQGRTIDYHKKQEIDPKQEGSSSLLPSNPLASNTRKAAVSIFAAPYFKDFGWYSHPENVDTLRKKEESELDVYVSAPKEWRKLEKKQLFSAVRENALKKKLAGITQQKNLVLAQVNNRYIEENEKEELMKKLEVIYRNEAIIRQQPDEELFKNPDEEYDWLSISAQEFDSFLSDKSCRLMWRNVLHPSINRGTWTRKEDETLQFVASNHLADRIGFINWDYVASQIGNRRTAFHCFMRFQQRHNNFLDRRKWTCHEDERLKKLVKQCKISSHFVPWPKVAYYMKHRTKDQCYQRYTISLQPHLRKGIFTENEDFVIIVGVSLFQNNWAKIAEFIPNRTPIQIHSRYNTFIKPNFHSWSKEEDNKLLKLTAEKGNNVWAEIAKNFDERTRAQCRNRFHCLYKMFELEPEKFTLDKIKYQSQAHISLQKRRQKKLYENLRTRLKSFLETQVNTVSKNSTNDIDNHQNSVEIECGDNKYGSTSSDKHLVNNQAKIINEKDDTDSGSESEEDLTGFNLELDNTEIKFSEDLNSDSKANIIKNSFDSNEGSYVESNFKSLHSLQVIPHGEKVSKRKLIEFMRSLQGDLPLKAAPGESGGYESMVYQRISPDDSNVSSSTNRYLAPMPMKRMSAFVYKDNKGALITRYKGNRGRSFGMKSVVCKQSILDRGLSSYFKSSWTGRVGKPVSTYKMTKYFNDQLTQGLGAANFYGQTLSVYPYDLEFIAHFKAKTRPKSSNFGIINPLLELYICSRNENLYEEVDGTASLNGSMDKEYDKDWDKETLSPQNMQKSQVRNNLISIPQIRTYSKKNKPPQEKGTAQSCEDKLSMVSGSQKNMTNDVSRCQKSYIHFVPPNNQTLVGMRGLIAELRKHKHRVYPKLSGVRLSLDRILQEGIHHIDLFSDTPEIINNLLEMNRAPKLDLGNQTATDEQSESLVTSRGDTEVTGHKKLPHQEADALLEDRFLSIFFWPALMSGMRPTSYDNLFDPLKEHDPASDYAGLIGGIAGSYPMTPSTLDYGTKYGALSFGRQSVAAENPFDASELLASFQSRATFTPHRFIENCNTENDLSNNSLKEQPQQQSSLTKNTNSMMNTSDFYSTELNVSINSNVTKDQNNTSETSDAPNNVSNRIIRTYSRKKPLQNINVAIKQE